MDMHPIRALKISHKLFNMGNSLKDSGSNRKLMKISFFLSSNENLHRLQCSFLIEEHLLWPYWINEYLWLYTWIYIWINKVWRCLNNFCLEYTFCVICMAYSMPAVHIKTWSKACQFFMRHTLILKILFILRVT